MSDTNKKIKFNLDRKLNPWLKFKPNFLRWLPKGKREKTTVYRLFSLFIKFLAVEIRLAFSRAKPMISSLQSLEKRWDIHARWWAIAIFQLTDLNVKANPPCFQYVRAIGPAKWHHKLCKERMRNANAKNHLNALGACRLNIIWKWVPQIGIRMRIYTLSTRNSLCCANLEVYWR